MSYTTGFVETGSFKGSENPSSGGFQLNSAVEEWTNSYQLYTHIPFHFVDDFCAAVVAPSRVAFTVLIVQTRTEDLFV
jgi:hypothetical protein